MLAICGESVYNLRKNEVKAMRVLAINDISCAGKCSLTVALPVLSACGATVDILPTALLSTHTGGFTGYTFLPLDDEMEKICAHWETLPLKYDVICSGYLGSRSQIEFVKSVKQRFLKPDGIFVVDPVLGDNFKFYKGFDEAFAAQMRTLCGLADYILPNDTESFLLTGEKDPEKALSALAKICPHPIITGADTAEGYFLYYYDGENKKIPLRKVEGSFHGAGDVFASAFAGCIGRGMPLKDALTLCIEFCYRAILRTQTEVPDKKYGMNYEKELSILTDAFKSH